MAIGQQDIALDDITPKDSQIEILGASSDHLLLDLTQSEREYQVEMRLNFQSPMESVLAHLRANTSNNKLEEKECHSKNSRRTNQQIQLSVKARDEDSSRCDVERRRNDWNRIVSGNWLCCPAIWSRWNLYSLCLGALIMVLMMLSMGEMLVQMPVAGNVQAYATSCDSWRRLYCWMGKMAAASGYCSNTDCGFSDYYEKYYSAGTINCLDHRLWTAAILLKFTLQ